MKKDKEKLDSRIKDLIQEIDIKKNFYHMETFDIEQELKNLKKIQKKYQKR